MKVVLWNTVFVALCESKAHLSTLATNAAGKLDVLGHDSHTLRMDGTQVGVLEQTHEVGLGRLLQR